MDESIEESRKKMELEISLKKIKENQDIKNFGSEWE